MKLTELAPRWYTDGGDVRLGVSFACPVHAHLGLDENGAADCALARVHVPTETPPGGFGDMARWTRGGDDFASMTLAPSVRCQVGPNGVHWHGHVTAGEVSILPDSTAPAWPEGWAR